MIEGTFYDSLGSWCNQCWRMTVNRDHKILYSPPLSKEVKTMSSVFPTPRPGQRNQYPSPCFLQHIPLVGPGYLPQGEANDMTVIQLMKLEGDYALILPPSLDQMLRFKVI